MTALNALRLAPLVLLAVAVLAFSRDRYYGIPSGARNSPGYYMMYGLGACAADDIIYGNQRIEAIEDNRRDMLRNAAWNMSVIDSYKPPPTPPLPVPKTRKQVLHQIPEWIGYGVELVQHTWEILKGYDREEIIAKINTLYDGQIQRVDSHMRLATTACAVLANEAQKRIDQINGMGAKYSITYGIRYTGINGWKAWPTRKLKPKVYVIGPLPIDGEDEQDESQKEQDAG